MKGLVFALGLALTIQPVAVRAQEAAPAAPQAQISKAGARADAIIAAANASDFFENITGDAATPKVRHKASGMICSFGLDSPASSITFFPTFARGDDVGCNESLLGVVMTVYATKPPQSQPLQTAFAGALATARAVHPDAQPYKGSVAKLSAPVMPATQEVFFQFTDTDGRMTRRPGTKLVSRLSMAKVGDWELKIRASAEYVDDQSAMKLSLISGSAWLMALGVLKTPPAKPAV